MYSIASTSSESRIHLVTRTNVPCRTRRSYALMTNCYDSWCDAKRIENSAFLVNSSRPIQRFEGLNFEGVTVTQLLIKNLPPFSGLPCFPLCFGNFRAFREIWNNASPLWSSIIRDRNYWPLPGEYAIFVFHSSNRALICTSQLH